MVKRYFIECNSVELSHQLNAIIDVKCTDNIATHFRQCILLENQYKTCGLIEGNTFKVWIPRSRWTGIFYPVLVGQVSQLDQVLQIEFKSKMNSLIKFPLYILAILLLYNIINEFIVQRNNEINYLLPRILGGTILFALLMGVPFLLLNDAQKDVKHLVIKKLDLREAI